MFIKGLKDFQDREDNFSYTENGAIALKSTGSPLLDLFGVLGGLRTYSEEYIQNLFANAYKEDALLATKMMFYARNVRGGLGERKVFRAILKFMANNKTDVLKKNIALIPEFGRWDDLYALVGTACEDFMWLYFKESWDKDIENYKYGKPVSLLAKWAKSINTSSKASRELGELTANKLYLSLRDYRKLLSYLRAYIDVTEKKMSANRWEDINYEGVPSVAMKNYNKAFYKHDANRFSDYIDEVSTGTKKINSSTLYPYDLLLAGKLDFIGNRYIGGDGSFTLLEDSPVIEAQWKALPNYVEGEHNVLVVADTSGSMLSDGAKPLATSIGLAIYFAERNKGAFKDVFMTFSRKPSFVSISGKTLNEKLGKIPSIVENTDLEKALDLILHVALTNKLKQEELPVSLVIISDMQFDQATSQYLYQHSPIRHTFYETMLDKYQKAGYNVPNIVFWNVGTYEKTYTNQQNIRGVQMFSGFSQAVFRDVLANVGKTPYEAMVQTLNNKMYDVVKI